MLFQELFARRRTRCFAGGTLHDPFWRFQKNRSNRDSNSGDDQITNLTLDLHNLCQLFFALDLSNHDDILSPEVGIVNAQRDYTAIMNGRVAGDDLLNVLRVKVLAADDEEIFLPADYVEFVFQSKAKIAGVVPAFDNCLGR